MDSLKAPDRSHVIFVHTQAVVPSRGTAGRRGQGARAPKEGTKQRWEAPRQPTRENAMHQRINCTEERSDAIDRIGELLDGLDRARQDMDAGKILPNTYLLLAGRYADRIKQAVQYGKSKPVTAAGISAA